MTNAARFVKDAELKKILKETSGLGTPATRAAIIETLINRGYIERKGKHFIALGKGISLINAVKDEKIADPAYTALWEQELDAIATGEVKSSEAFMKEIKDYTKEIVEKAKGATMEPQNNNHGSKESLGKCPECRADVYESPKSFSCSAWKEKGCKFTLWKDNLKRFGKKAISVKQAAELLQGKQVKFTGLKSKAGKTFEAEGKLAKDEKYGWQVQLIFQQKS